MQANSQCHNYYSFIWSFGSGECGKEGKKLQKFEYIENEKSFLDEIKKNEGLSFDEKLKIW